MGEVFITHSPPTPSTEIIPSEKSANPWIESGRPDIEIIGEHWAFSVKLTCPGLHGIYVLFRGRSTVRVPDNPLGTRVVVGNHIHQHTSPRIFFFTRSMSASVTRYVIRTLWNFFNVVAGYTGVSPAVL